MAVGDIVRQLGISEQTFYRWKKRYGGMQSEGVRELTILQDENARLKKLVAELSLDKAILQDVASKKVGRPALKREVVDYITDHYGLKLARACQLIKQVRSTQYLSARRIRSWHCGNACAKLAQVRVRWGSRRLHVLLKREGFQLGVNQTYRWYCLEQLQLRAWRKKRRKSAVARQARVQPRRANDAWSMDFVADQLADGTKIRLLTIIDIYSRESLASWPAIACAEKTS